MIPVSEPLLGPDEHLAVMEALRSGWISSAGPALDAFESRWAAVCGRRHGIAVANGTVALHAAVKALGVKPGDEVILPSFTIISCASAVVEAGGVPVAVDVDPHTWGVDAAQVEAAITPRTVGVMVVHMYGHPCNMDPLLELVERKGLWLLEDAAEAHGAKYLSRRGSPEGHWRTCGGFGAASTFSFYANKIITTGEGGMVVTDDDALATRLRALRNLCFEPPRRFVHRDLGNNHRLTNLQAALALPQIASLHMRVERKRAIARRYLQALQGVPGLVMPVERDWAHNVYWMFGVVLERAHPGSALQVAEALRSRGVETRPFFFGMHQQPALKGRVSVPAPCPVTEWLGEKGFYLPCGLTLSEPQQDQVVAMVREVLG